MRIFSASLLSLTLCNVLLADGQVPPSRDNRSVCVAPVSKERPTFAATPDLLCDSGDLKWRRHDQNPITWANEKSEDPSELHLNRAHGGTIYWGNKPQQSSRVRLSQFIT